MYGGWLRTYSQEDLKMVWTCVHDGALAYEHLTVHVNPHLSSLVAAVLMDSKLRSYMRLCAQLDWDITAAELSWR